MGGALRVHRVEGLVLGAVQPALAEGIEGWVHAGVGVVVLVVVPVEAASIGYIGVALATAELCVRQLAATAAGKCVAVGKLAEKPGSAPAIVELAEGLAIAAPALV